MVKAKKTVAKTKKVAKKSAGKAAVKKAVKKPAKKVKVVAKKVNLKKVSAIAGKMTKSQILQNIAEHAGISRKEVGTVFQGLAVCVHGAMKGFGEISIPETGIKVRRIRKPATKKRKMISPFTGQEIMVKAKPARNVVKVSALKSLKESVA